MLDFLDILPESIFFMASILGGMGTGSNTGKITFKKISSGGDLTITEDSKSLTFNLTSGISSSPAIPLSQIVFGDSPTPTGITSSVRFRTCAGNSGDYASQYGNCIFGFGSIIPGMIGTIKSCDPYGCEGHINSYNNIPNKSLILGGGNRIDNSIGSMIIAGFTNSIKESFDSVIVAGYANKISSYSNGLGPVCSAIVSSRKSCIYNNNCQSFIASSNCSGLYLNQKQKFGSIISSACSCIMSYYNSGCDRHQQILASYNSRIYSGGLPKCGCIIGNSILTSRNSCIWLDGSKISVQGFQKYNNIISSDNSLIISTQSSLLGASSSYNNIISSDSSKISGKNNTIMSSASSEIKTFSGLNGVPNPFNTIISGREICICNLKYSSIINSTNFCHYTNSSRVNNVEMINSQSSKFCENSCYSTLIGTNNSFNYGSNYTSIIGGKCNSICKSYTSILGGNKGDVKRSITTFDCEDLSGSLLINPYNVTASFFSIASNCSSFFSLSGGIGGLNNCAAFTTLGLGVVSGCYESTFFKCTADHSLIIGGKCNRSDSNQQSSIILGSYRSRILNAKNNVIIGGSYNTILSLGQYYNKDAGDFCNRSNRSFIIGGMQNCLRNAKSYNPFPPNAIYCLENSGIIGGFCNAISSDCSCNLIIVGGRGLTSSKTNTLVIQNLAITGTLSTASGASICCGVTGTFNDVKVVSFVNGIVTSVVTL